MRINSPFLNNGIYTVPDAARLSRVSGRRIRYWLRDEKSEKKKESIHKRLWTGQLAPIDDKLALGFYDLQEVRFIDAFLKQGVSWTTLRRAHAVAKLLYKTQHPFCTRQFVTDGRDVFDSLKSESQGEQLTDVIRGQRVFPSITVNFLKELKFSKDEELLSWWPLGLQRMVVLDPARQFGQPVTAKEGVATEILYQAFRAGQNTKEVAEWYEISEVAVRDAVDFEVALRA